MINMNHKRTDSEDLVRSYRRKLSREFWRGVRTFVILGPREVRPAPVRRETDAEALAKDWRDVGDYLRQSIQTFKSTL